MELGWRSVQASLRIHRAIKCLQIQPEQFAAPAHINKSLARELVTCHEMLAVHAAYASVDNPHGKLYTTMINTIAWRFVNDPEMQIGRKRQLSQAKRVRLIIAEKRANRDEMNRIAAAWASAEEG
jgi:hypothetical protein